MTVDSQLSLIVHHLPVSAYAAGHFTYPSAACMTIRLTSREKAEMRIKPSTLLMVITPISEDVGLLASSSFRGGLGFFISNEWF